MTDSERMTKVFKISMEMLAYGIKIEDAKETTSFLGLPENCKVYFSIPETSTVYDDNKDAEFNAKLKTTDGLTEIAKKLIIDMFMCSDDSDIVKTTSRRKIFWRICLQEHTIKIRFRQKAIITKNALKFA